MINKQEELKEEILNSNNIKYNYLILKLLNENIINELTNKITNTKTKINVTSLQKKEYLTGNEQFLMLLSNTIYFFKEEFYFLNNNTDFIINILLQDKKNTKYLLSKKYIGNNINMPFFTYSMKKLIVNNFYINLKIITNKSNIIKKFIKDNKINAKKNLTKQKKEIDIIYETLIKLSMCNAKFSNNTLLFENINNYTKKTESLYKNNNIKKMIENFYIKEYEIMINNYYNKIDIINSLIE